jgi:fructoselysine-6-P-deglycase FrlB-like protein
MKTIKSYENEIFSQPEFLKKFQLQRPISNDRHKRIIFSGSGDSLAAAMLAEVYSDYQARAFDPLDLIKNNHLLKNKISYFVSISGKTISNIRAAKIAKNAIAITNNQDSELAKNCDKSISLNFPKSETFTAGSISFLTSALTCISLVKKISIPENDKIFRKALNDAKKSRLRNRIFILGNLKTFPLAMYCAAKIYEVLGLDAHYTRIEQFSHMELFASSKGDTIIILEEKNNHNRNLAKNLKQNGINVIQPEFESRNEISQLLYFVYYSQLLALFEAKRRRKNECHFVTEKKIRNTSNQMIY